MRTIKQLLEILAEYVNEDYEQLIEYALANDRKLEAKELEEERNSILEDINREILLKKEIS